MRKSGIFVLALFAATAVQAQPQYLFRFVHGGAGVTAPSPIDPEPPETPEVPKGNAVLEFNGQGMLTHLDANGNGLVDGGDAVTGTFRVSNTGDGAAENPVGDGNFYVLNPYTAVVNYYHLGLPISCPSVIEPGDSVDCTTTYNVTADMLPASRIDYYVAFEMAFNSRYITQISEFLPLGLPSD